MNIKGGFPEYSLILVKSQIRASMKINDEILLETW